MCLVYVNVWLNEQIKIIIILIIIIMYTTLFIYGTIGH